jgi:hypothetical protein
MSATRITAALGSIFLMGVICSAQSDLELKPIDFVKIPNLPGNNFSLPIKCDAGSNIYVEVGQPSDAGGRTPVVRITPEGKATVFPLPTLEDKKPLILDFAPAADGGIALLTMDADRYEAHYYVETYREDGQKDWRFALPPNLDPMQIAVSPKGKILVCGLWSTGGPGPLDMQDNRPFAGVFDSSGRLEREATLTEDVQFSPKKSPAAGSGSAHVGYNPFEPFSFSSAQFSSNESFVLARLHSGGPIFTISPDGFAMNVIHPTVPPGAQLSSVIVRGNIIAAVFIKMKSDTTQDEISDTYISLLNSQTGEEQVRYHHSLWQLGAALACYDDKDVFSFLTWDQNDRLQIARAGAR